MSLINRLTRGMIHKDGEFSIIHRTGIWEKHGQHWFNQKLIRLLDVYIPFLPIWLLTRFDVKWAKKLLGRLLGFSKCSGCGMTWNYATEKHISYSEHSGMFPICTECFDRMEPDEIDEHIRNLVLEWIEDCHSMRLPWSQSHDKTPTEIIMAAQAEMRRMKGEEAS